MRRTCRVAADKAQVSRYTRLVLPSLCVRITVRYTRDAYLPVSPADEMRFPQGFSLKIPLLLPPPRHHTVCTPAAAPLRITSPTRAKRVAARHRRCCCCCFFFSVNSPSRRSPNCRVECSLGAHIETRLTIGERAANAFSKRTR